MGFRMRERRRRKKLAQQAAHSASRHPGSSAGKGWLTSVRKKTCCARHGGVLSPGRDMVYRHEPREALCQACANREGIHYRPSLRWERERKRKRITT
jgi:hypothetical protein